MRTCKECNSLQEDENFYKVSPKNRGSICKMCIAIRNRIKRGTLHKFDKELFKKKIEAKVSRRPKETAVDIYDWENEIFEYIWKVRTRGYGVDDVDFLRIIHYHEILWPLWHEPYITLETIKLKWVDLEGWYLKNKDRIYEQERNSHHRC